MPLYDYRCKVCDQAFELLIRVSETPVCPGCGSQDLIRQLPRPAAPGQTAELLSKARAQAAKEGHFSHYKPSERPRIRR
jgi:putative FmdB family regulatory protein